MTGYIYFCVLPSETSSIKNFIAPFGGQDYRNFNIGSLDLVSKVCPHFAPSVAAARGVTVTLLNETQTDSGFLVKWHHSAHVLTTYD